jgi:hypothetical protein
MARGHFLVRQTRTRPHDFLLLSTRCARPNFGYISGRIRPADSSSRVYRANLAAWRGIGFSHKLFSENDRKMG